MTWHNLTAQNLSIRLVDFKTLDFLSNWLVIYIHHSMFMGENKNDISNNLWRYLSQRISFNIVRILLGVLLLSCIQQTSVSGHYTVMTIFQTLDPSPNLTLDNLAGRWLLGFISLGKQSQYWTPSECAWKP